MDTILGDLCSQGKAIRFADNVFTGGTNEEEFISNLNEVLSRLAQANLRLKPSKMKVAISKTTIMGWNWSDGKITPSVHHINPLTVCDKPKTVTGLRSFLGGMRFHKRCLDNFSQPLDEGCPSNLPGTTPIVWTPQMEEAFSACQNIMKKPASVIGPHRTDQLIQIADGALNLPAVGAILVALREGEPKCLPESKGPCLTGPHAS